MIKDKSILFNDYPEISDYEKRIILSHEIKNEIENGSVFYSIDQIIQYIYAQSGLKLSTATVSRRLDEIENITKYKVAKRIAYYTTSEYKKYDTNHHINRLNEYVSAYKIQLNMKHKLLGKETHFDELREIKYDHKDFVSQVLIKMNNMIIDAAEKGEHEIYFVEKPFDQNDCLDLSLSDKKINYNYEANAIFKYLKRQKFDVQLINATQNKSLLRIKW